MVIFTFNKLLHEKTDKMFHFSLFSPYFFSCEPLPRGKKVRERQQSFHEIIIFNKDWKFQRREKYFSPTKYWEEIFLPHSVRIEPLVLNDQWQGMLVYRKSFQIQKHHEENWFSHIKGVRSIFS